jgi:membrane protease YdiL (CAAX protease family)
VEQVSIDPTPPPPERPELPEGAGPRWPAWYAGIGFLVALISTLLVVGIVAAATGTSTTDESPTFTVVATFLQGLVFIGTAVLFASFAGKPRAEHFGLRWARFWPTVGWAALGLVSFYILAALYTAILQPDVEQTVAQDLGADQGTLGMIAAGFMVICVAPVGEEFFFRGFFYRALRSRYSILAAALIDGILFGAIHWDFSSADGLLIIPPLAALGFIFCLIYERTGSLYPVIAMHAVNNAIAFGFTVDDVSVSLGLGSLMLVACTAAPRAQRTAMA